jgi:hypothetical protein
VIPLEVDDDPFIVLTETKFSQYDCIRRRPDFLFCCLIEFTMTVVKSVSDGLRD